jgi:hypothetical protein
MRKFWVAGTAVMLVLALAAIAIAQDAVTNTYDVDGSTSPAAKGSKKKPVPIGINFDYSVGEAQGRRPSPVKKYSIRFYGTQVNTNVVPGCSKATLDNEGPDGCKAKAIVGTGYIENATGNRADPNDQSVVCNAKLWVINQGDRKANIYVKGSPSATDQREKCAIELAAPIPAQYVRKGSYTALEFNVPDTLLHPLPTLNNAVKRVQSKIKRLTKKIKGKNRGYFEAIGGCQNGGRAIEVVFTPEQGNATTAQHKAKC